MFEQHDRWLEELLEYTSRKESVTCTSGCMPLTAIAQEIATACADNRQHSRQQSPNWQSMASDLADTLDWIGPDLQALVDHPARAVHHTVTNDLLVTGPNGGAGLDDSKRPVVAAQTAALTAILDRDDVLVAAWRDLVSACRDAELVREDSDRQTDDARTHLWASVEHLQYRRERSTDRTQSLSDHRRDARQNESSITILEIDELAALANAIKPERFKLSCCSRHGVACVMVRSPNCAATILAKVPRSFRLLTGHPIGGVAISVPRNRVRLALWL